MTTRHRLWSLGAPLALGALLGPAAQAQLPESSEIRVSEPTRLEVSSGQIAYLPDGRLLLTWNLYGPRLFPSPDFMVRTRSRVLGPNGVLSEEFRLEQAVGNIVLPSGEQDGQAFPLIGYWNPFPGRIDPATYWRVSWFSTADGARTGGPYRLLPPSWGVVAAATVASRTLLVMGRNDPEQPCCVWQPNTSILSHDDPTLTDPVQLLPEEAEDHWAYSVVPSSSGRFLITGSRPDAEGSEFHDVFLLALAADGRTRVALETANTVRDDYQFNAYVAPGPSDGAIVAWQSQRQDGDLGGIFAQRFDSNLSKIGPEFRVNEITRSDQREPRIASDPEGNFAVVWKRFVPDQFGYETNLRLFGAGGAPVTPREMRANQIRGGASEENGVAAFGPRGTLAVAFTALRGGPHFTHALYLRRYLASPGDDACVLRGAKLFCDGVRSGGEAEITFDLASLGASISPESVLLADFSGDGRADFCVLGADRVSCDSNHQNGKATLVLTTPAGRVLAGDVDGDGRDDLCGREGSILSCDTDLDGVVDLAWTFGLPSDLPLLGDLDGDGRDDLCTVHGATFACDLAHDGGSAEFRVDFGPAGQEPFLGDLDRDGRADPCRYGAGAFRCDTAHDGGSAESRLVFGQRGDRPILRNLDGL